MMFVRLALEEDFDAIVEMARMNIAETRPGMVFNEATNECEDEDECQKSGGKGSSINDVTHIWRFFDTPLPRCHAKMGVLITTSHIV